MRKLPSFLLATVSTALAGGQAIAGSPMIEECHGSETVKMGTSTPRVAPYNLMFKADLSQKTYCYGQCTAAQTYPIANAHASPIELANLNKGGQIRHMTFDPKSGALSDYQVFDGPFGTVTRNASVTCKPGKF